MTTESLGEPAGLFGRADSAATRRRLALVVALAAAWLCCGSVLADEPEALPKAALAAQGFDRALLDPVDGLSLRRYAHIAFDSFAGDEPDMDKVLARYGVARAQFDHANAAFIERLRGDKSYVMSEIYGAYFIESAGGKYAALAADVARSVLDGAPLREAAPMAWDQYLELMRFYGANVSRAKATSRAAFDEILKPKGLSFVDYQIIGAWFGRRMRLGGGP
ncbi:MAG: hypothetical protein ACLQE9_02740 [Roseiarcus sp.]